MRFASNHSFEPRVGTAQLVFGVIYCFITVIAMTLALYKAQTTGETPTLHYFMGALFAIMALKSFVIWKKIRSLMENGVYYEAKVDSCEPVRGITIIKGTCDVRDYGLIYIESKLVGESVAHEINRYMQETGQDRLPALVVDEKNRPRGMFTVKCANGHLVEESLKLRGEADARGDAASDGASSAADGATIASSDASEQGSNRTADGAEGSDGAASAAAADGAAAADAASDSGFMEELRAAESRRDAAKSDADSDGAGTLNTDAAEPDAAKSDADADDAAKQQAPSSAK